MKTLVTAEFRLPLLRRVGLSLWSSKRASRSGRLAAGSSLVGPGGACPSPFSCLNLSLIFVVFTIIMTNEILKCLDSKHAGPSNPGSRKPSGARASPSNSPTLLKNQLPSAQEPTQTPSPRPSALRSQSYSKRHASFDTPREVPMPPMPTGTSSIDPIALDDSDMERNHAAAASWKYASRQPQSGSRHAETSRRPMEQSTSFRRASAAVPPSADILTRDGMNIDLSNEAYSQPPQICRNNSAPTPPHTPSAERMDLRYPQPNDADSGNSSERDGSGSEQTSPTPNSAGAEVPERGYLGQQRDGVKGAQNGPQSSAEALFREGRLSTASLPLPRSYGAERVSRLPPPARPTPQGGNASGSGSGSDGGQQAKTPTNLPRRPNTNLERLDSSKTFTDDSLNPGSAVTYRTSYPFTGMFARDVPLVPGHRGSSLVADVEKNAQAGTAWRSSSPFMRRDYSEEDSEAKSAISSGQIPKLPEIEAPSAPLHPFLETSTFTTPSSSARAFNFGPSSTTATPGHEKTSPGTISVDRPTLSNISSAEGDAKSSPAHSVDRTSTASGSSRAASDLAIFPENPNSEPKDLESSPAQSQGRNGKEPSRNDIIGSNRATNLSSRPRPTTEPTPMTSSSAIGGPTMTVDTTPSAYILEATLPGYQRDEITLSTRKKRILHVVADGFVSGGGKLPL